MAKRLTATVLTLAMVLALAAYASAAVCDKKIRLAATAAGQAINADGNARVRSRPRGLATRQGFTVEVTAAVANGTTFTVFANGQPAGTMTIAFGRGVLDLSNAGGTVLPAGVDPVCSIGSVVVADGAGTILLTGSF